MNTNETRTLWISIGAAFIAVFMLYTYSQEKQAEYNNKFGATKRVVVAAEDIADMQTLNETMLTIVERPISFIEPHAISNPETVIGQVAVAPIKKGEQVLETKLLTPGPDTGISLQIAPKKRALSIPLDNVRGVNKLIQPGDRIDILAAVDVGAGVNQVKKVQLLLQDIIVLATGQNIVHNIPRLLDVESDPRSPSWIRLKGDTQYSTITIEVDIEEAQKLVYMLTTAPGNLFTVLRNPNDKFIAKSRPIGISDVVGQTSQFTNIPSRIPASSEPPKPKAPTKKRLPPKKARGGFVPL